MKSAAAPPTFEVFDLPGDCRLVLNTNVKMKTVSVLVWFLGNLEEASVTPNSLLPSVLRRGTRSFPDMQAISRHLEGLYGTTVNSSVRKIGEWHVVRFRLEVVNEIFVPGETEILRRGLEFLRELLHEPHRVAGGFQPDCVEQEKKNLERSIASLVDNKGAYAEHRMFEEMCREEPFRLLQSGRIEDIPAIDPTSLWDYYEGWRDRRPVHVYVAGDIDLTATRDLVEEVFTSAFSGRAGGYVLSPEPADVPAPSAPREVVERLEVNQAKLVLGFRHGIHHTDSLYEALLVMNGVLGGFSHSKLFQNVREKASLAYSVHSGLERTKGILVISAGIGPGQYEKALEIILEQVEQMKAGEITDEEIQATVSTLINSNNMLEDALPSLCEVHFVWGIHGRTLDLEAFRKRLLAVSRDDIVEAARRLQHDTTYLLTS
jgi:predicted Zn-dependent peptidase